jgi:hypothetical protein
METLTTHPISVTAGNLQEVDPATHPSDGPWIYDDDGDEPQEAYQMSPYSQRIEARLRELLNEIQMDRLKEPDATTWLYHLSGTIENVKMDLAN